MHEIIVLILQGITRFFILRHIDDDRWVLSFKKGLIFIYWRVIILNNFKNYSILKLMALQQTLCNIKYNNVLKTLIFNVGKDKK